MENMHGNNYNIMKDFNPSYVGVRHDLIKHITSKNNYILDVGCANGANGKFLLEQGLAQYITGIEYDSKMSNEAKENYNKIFIGDLDNKNFLEEVLEDDTKYDYIIFGDVLEHLKSAESVLRNLTALLKPKGKVILSVPNIAHLELFVQVYLNGHWPRNDRGIFDKTHLTWFTKKDILEMVLRCGLKNVEYYSNTRSRDKIGSQFTWPYKILRKIKPELFTFQHILVAEKIN